MEIIDKIQLEKEVVEEEQEKQMTDLLNNRLVHVTHVEFSDIYL